MKLLEDENKKSWVMFVISIFFLLVVIMTNKLGANQGILVIAILMFIPIMFHFYGHDEAWDGC